MPGRNVESWMRGGPSGIDCTVHERHVTPLYKWLGTGAPSVEEQQTRNWPSRKRSTKRL